MADIMTRDGCKIMDEARLLTPLPSQPSTWIWPIEQPSWYHDLTAWLKGLQLFSSLACFYLRQGDHLGFWITALHQEWNGIGSMSPTGIDSTNIPQKAGRNSEHDLINMTAGIISLLQVYGLMPYQLELNVPLL